MATKPASLDAMSLPGTAEKGGAKPAATTVTKPKRQLKTQKKRTGGKTQTRKKTITRKAEEPAILTALTVKIDESLYRALQLHKIETRQTHQDILTQALRSYLNT